MFKEDNTEKELFDVDPEVLEASKEIYYVSEGRIIDLENEETL